MNKPDSSRRRRRRAFWLAAGLAGLLFALLKAYELSLWLDGWHVEARHRPLAAGAMLDFASAGFDDYLAWSRERLRAAHPEASEEEIARLSPFRLEPAAACPRAPDGRWMDGIVLVHGELESAHSMAALGRELQSRCFLVLGLLLPGHGTRPGDFDQWRWEDWAAVQRLALRELEGAARHLFLGGHSAGGALALFEAAGNPEVDGLLLFAPLLDLRRPPFLAGPRTALGRLIRGAAWQRIVPDETPYRYESLSLAGWAEVEALAAAARRAVEERPPAIPVFTVASMEDETADTAALLDILAALPHPRNSTLLYSRFPRDARPGVELYGSYLPSQLLLSLSHLGLMLPRSDPIFGFYGSVHSCRHYWRGDLRRYYLCLEGRRDLLGEVTPGQMEEAGVLERIAFNPYYERMLASLDAFLRNLDFMERKERFDPPGGRR